MVCSVPSPPVSLCVQHSIHVHTACAGDKFRWLFSLSRFSSFSIIYAPVATTISPSEAGLGYRYSIVEDVGHGAESHSTQILQDWYNMQLHSIALCLWAQKVLYFTHFYVLRDLLYHAYFLHGRCLSTAEFNLQFQPQPKHQIPYDWIRNFGFRAVVIQGSQRKCMRKSSL